MVVDDEDPDHAAGLRREQQLDTTPTNSLLSELVGVEVSRRALAVTGPTPVCRFAVPPATRPERVSERDEHRGDRRPGGSTRRETPTGRRR